MVDLCGGDDDKGDDNIAEDHTGYSHSATPYWAQPVDTYAAAMMTSLEIGAMLNDYVVNGYMDMLVSRVVDVYTLDSLAIQPPSQFPPS